MPDSTRGMSAARHILVTGSANWGHVSNLRCEPVDMVPSLPVVQGIEAEPEALEEVDSILWLHDVILIRLQEKMMISR